MGSPNKLELADVSAVPHARFDNDNSKVPVREEWDNKMDFMLSCIGFAVGLGNVWRFPHLCYENGGGAFLIPYFIFLAICGVPLFFMELSIAQYMQKGPISCWKAISLPFQGIGYAMLVISFLVSIYYNVILGWALYYLFESFRAEVPWKHCNQPWNTDQCSEKIVPMRSGVVNSSIVNATSKIISWGVTCDADFTPQYFGNGSLKSCVFNGPVKPRVSPSSEFWERHVLNLSDGIGNAGDIQWYLALTLLLAWFLVYFSIWKGVKSSGKVVYFTATFPYLMLFILMIQGATLEGSLDGVKYYLSPDFSKLKEAKVWVRAASQIFYSLGVASGPLLTMGSYNKFKNNCLKDAITVSLINCGTSVFAGFVVFTVIGHMAHVLHENIENVASSGPGLAFVVYPEGIAQMDASPFWAIMFFVMLLTLGLDSMFGSMECIVTAISDEYPRYLRKYKELFILVVCVICYMIGLSNVTSGGAYVLNLMDTQAGGISLLFVGFCETICIGWFYGADRLLQNIEEMIGYKPSNWWKIAWKYIGPVFIMTIILFSLATWEGVKYDGHPYPVWAEVIGWFMAASSMVWIPVMFVYAIWKANGNIKQRMNILYQPDPTVFKNPEESSTAAVIS